MEKVEEIYTYVCDVCGNEENKMPPVYCKLKINGAHYFNLYLGVVDFNEKKDLCENCTKKLLNFLNTTKENENE